MISSNDFRKGSKIEFRGDPYEVIDFQHVKVGRGGATIRTKMKNLRTGSIIEESFRGGEKLSRPHLEEKSMQYLYSQDNMYYYMDVDSFEQMPLSADQLGNNMKFIKENMVVKVLYYSGNPIGVELPIFVELKIVKTDPGVKGDTASGGSKPAVMETGVTIKVPFHLNEGDTIKIDTRTSEYVARVK
ncbi:MAG TPA: elongation factor P [Nitrospirae bacterium]|nr:elongation factor P [Nitrospirota bacterium]